MSKQKRKRESSLRFNKVPYTLIAIGIILVTFIAGFSIGATLVTLQDQPLKREWKGYMTETAVFKATHDPVILVTQTVSAIETQWTQINITQTAISKQERP